ncbi:MAG: sensor histidine kinase [Motiliproteus sp.]
MLSTSVIIISISAYLALLFAIAFFGDRRAEQHRSIISNPYIYSLSIAVYCTAWTFFGSVGYAARNGLGFLPIYLGPTLMAALWWFVLRKIIRISRKQRITSIADFIGSRYGKSARLTGMVTLIAVLGILPYISLQLKAIANSFLIISDAPSLSLSSAAAALPLWHDTAFYVALLLAAFTILFGTRHLDVTERHEGMVAAIAFESVVKLLAFMAVGGYVTFGLFDGPGDIFSRAVAKPELARLLTMEALPGGYSSWFSLTLISMSAVLFLPRQFQVAVVENVNDEHLRKASWLFPLYLLLINLFVLPIALGGLLLFDGSGVDPDTFVLSIPMAQHAEWLTLLVFIGGVSAATGMVIVATIALSTMISNELIMPLLLRTPLRQSSEQLALPDDLSRWVLRIRRGSIVVILLLAYLYFRLVGESYALVSIGLVSFVAAAQFAPAILIGIYWKGATRAGALAGLSSGFLIWGYTLMLPALAKSGWLPLSLVEQGLFGIAFLKPYALFGLADLDPITHAVFWSLPINVFLLVIVSLRADASVIEKLQAREFVDAFKDVEPGRGQIDVWRGTVTVAALQALVARFTGNKAAARAFRRFAREHGFNLAEQTLAEPHTHLVSYGERLIAGVIGAASARVMISTLYKGQTLNIDDVMDLLDETSQVVEYSHQLEQKTHQYQIATRKLRAANQRLQQLDRLKDDFVSTVSHELRTPLTSIRAFSEILLSEPDLACAQRQEFLQIVVDETQRLTRLINDVLDLAKIDAGKIEWKIAPNDLRAVINDATKAVYQLYQQRDIGLSLSLPDSDALAEFDRDRMQQVIINLLSNAAKFCAAGEGQVRVSLEPSPQAYTLCIEDNGPGITADAHARLFDKFEQVEDEQQGKPKGSGLGLAICKGIVEHHQGRIWLDSAPGAGSRFYVSLPRGMDG